MYILKKKVSPTFLPLKSVAVIPKETKDEEKELHNVLSWVGKGGCEGGGRCIGVINGKGRYKGLKWRGERGSWTHDVEGESCKDVLVNFKGM